MTETNARRLRVSAKFLQVGDIILDDDDNRQVWVGRPVYSSSYRMSAVGLSAMVTSPPSDAVRPDEQGWVFFDLLSNSGSPRKDVFVHNSKEFKILRRYTV